MSSDEDQLPPNIAQFMLEAESSMINGLDINAVYEQHKDNLSAVYSYDPLKLAAAFAGLLTRPELQSNCVRLEALTHLALALGNGRRAPNRKIVGRLFKELGQGWAGRSEDPAEDVFVSVITTPRGNFRILEGVWESAGFYTQRLVNAIETLPNKKPFSNLKNETYALLRLSESVCERAKLPRNCVGNSSPDSKIAAGILGDLAMIKRIVQFSDDELASLSIEPEDLLAFGFDPSSRRDLLNERVGQSSLERYPVAAREGQYILVLPTAASAAIRTNAIAFMTALDLREAFAATLSLEYAETFASSPLLGGYTGAPIEFKRTQNGTIAGVMYEPDEGLFVNLVFYCDTLDEFSDGGLLGFFPTKNDSKLGDDLNKWIDHAFETAKSNETFREGLTLVVPCGIGRGSVLKMEPKERSNWWLEFVSAPQFQTICWLPDFDSLSLWRLLKGQDKLGSLGVDLQNMNGLLNTVAWARSLGGHLVPHSSLPDDFGGAGAFGFLMIDQNALLKARHEVAEAWDVHAIKDIRDQWVTVRRDGQSLYREDRLRPFYIADNWSETRWPMGVFETEKRGWWIQLETGDGASGYSASERFKMLRTWICRIAPVAETTLARLPDGPLLLKFCFEGDLTERRRADPQGFLTLEETLEFVTVESRNATVCVRINPEFERAFLNPTNIAERALVQRAYEGLINLAEASVDEQEFAKAMSRIIPSPDARQSHAFMAQTFRDFVASAHQKPVVTIDPDDAATIKLNLAWEVRDRTLGNLVSGKSACTSFLNTVVKHLEDEVCRELRKFDRTRMIRWALLNHERAAADRAVWRRTSRAALALSEDKQDATNLILEHEGALNAVFQASRVLIEFAVCECPETGGLKPGKRDLSRLMARVMMISGMGGWSDAIHWDAMEPKLTITALGDIHANATFSEQVLEPYGRASAEVFVKQSIEDYEKNLRESEPVKTDFSVTDGEFWEALREEFGCPFEITRKFVDHIEDIGLDKKLAVFTCRRSELVKLDLVQSGFSMDELDDFVSKLTIRSRNSWREIPDGFLDRDIFPWRFRRRLSTLRRPLIQLEDMSDDPLFLVAPGLMRDALSYMVGNYHRGDFPDWQLSPKMLRWKGKAMHKMRSTFSNDVAEKMRDLGWSAESEVPLTKLLKKSLDANYGDIDVLAWNPETARVLLIECKDLQFRKTEGEIAEQLSDFRGELNRDGKPDLLLKHMRRIEVVLHDRSLVSAYTGIDAPKVEGHLVFKNPVPMKYAWDHIKERVALSLFDELHRI